MYGLDLITMIIIRINLKLSTQKCNFLFVQNPVDWLNVYPEGMEKIVTYLMERYNNTPMFITENGKQRVDMGIDIPISWS